MFPTSPVDPPTWSEHLMKFAVGVIRLNKNFGKISEQVFIGIFSNLREIILMKLDTCKKKVT